MTEQYYELPGLGGIYLEDSYVLGIDQDDHSLTFDLDVVLTEQHPEYRPPLPGEQYCYRRATLTFPNYRNIQWLERTEATNVDPDGSVDHGNIDTFTRRNDHYTLSGEWGHLTIHADPPILTLTPDPPSQTFSQENILLKPGTPI